MATSIVGKNISDEMAPFSVSVRAKTMVKPVPSVYLPWEKIQSVMEKNTQYGRNMSVYFHITIFT